MEWVRSGTTPEGSWQSRWVAQARPSVDSSASQQVSEAVGGLSPGLEASFQQ